MSTETKELTFGQRLVGLTFNPSNDDKVGKAKQLCADLADLVHEEYSTRKFDHSELNKIDTLLFTHTIGEIINAQMNAVKVLTLKY
jgi:hypothetical protein